MGQMLGQVIKSDIQMINERISLHLNNKLHNLVSLLKLQLNTTKIEVKNC